ncbi:MAG: DNA repair protein RecN [Sumerlaeia bacterium]
MINLLRIRDLALIDSLDIEFGPGLNALTGETGSGKSIVLTSIGLLLGGRAQPASVRGGAKRATVEAILDIAGRPGVQHWLTEQGLESPEPNELLLRREVLSTGRSRGSINGRLATAGQLADLGRLLVEIHGQNDQQSLLQPARQRALFDDHCVSQTLRLAVAETYDRYTEARERFESLSAQDSAWRQRLDFLDYQIREIEELGLSPGEKDGLLAERERLAHVDSLQRGVGEILACLSESPAAEPVAIDLVGTAHGTLHDLCRYDQGLADVAESLNEAMARLQDASRDLEGYLSRLEGDPNRLATIDDRLEAIKRLERKHGCEAENLLAKMESMAEEAGTLRNRDSHRDELTESLNRLEHDLRDRAQALTAARQRECDRFATEVVHLLKDLSMPGVRFQVALLPHKSSGLELSGHGDPIRVSREGAEQIEFLISTNDGEDLHPLRKIASGGEVSRVMLALRTLSAEKEAVPVLIFDEVDAGISGIATRSVAARLAELGGRHQILCVTHQAAIASQADMHLVVSKSPRGGRTITTVIPVNGDQRRQELARLLDGAVSDKSLELANEMLSASA